MPIVPLGFDWTYPRADGILPENYMCEDMFYSGHTKIFIHPDCLFREGLVQCFGDENIIQSDICGMEWVRDPIIRTSTGLLFALFLDPFAHRRIPIPHSYPDWIPANRFYDIELHGNAYMKGKKFLLTLAFAQRVLQDENVTLGLHQLEIAGGNLITGRRWCADYRYPLESPLITLMGKNACFALAFFLKPEEIRALLQRRFDSGMARASLPHLERKWSKKALPYPNPFHSDVEDDIFTIEKHIFPAFQAAKQLIHEFYGINMPGSFVKLVDQWSYHIDLSMGYLGGGVVLIHDFIATSQFLLECSRDEAFITEMAIQLKDAGETLETKRWWVKTAIRILWESAISRLTHENSQRTVDNAVRSIERAGMVAVRVPVCLFIEARRGTLEYASTELMDTPRGAVVLANRLAHNLCNGIAVDPMIRRESGHVTEVTFRWVCPGPVAPLQDVFFSRLCEAVERTVRQTMHAKHAAAAPHIPPPRFSIEWKIVPAQDTYPTSHGFDILEGPPLSPTSAGLTDATDLRATTTATTMIAYSGGLRCQTMLFGTRVANCFQNNRLFRQIPPQWQEPDTQFCMNEYIISNQFMVQEPFERMLWGIRETRGTLAEEDARLSLISTLGARMQFEMRGYSADLVVERFRVAFHLPPADSIGLMILHEFE